MTGVYPRLQSIDFMSSFEEGERESKATPKSDVVSVATPTATATAATPNSSSTSLPSGAICFYSKHQRYYEFTNFYRASIFVDGHWYATSENYFQSQKCVAVLDRVWRGVGVADEGHAMSTVGLVRFKGSVAEKSIRAAHSAREAFSLAREPQFQQYRRADWAGVKDHVMLRGLRAKFSQHPHLRTLLLSTESKPLVEHTVNDSYWADGGDGSGANRLGQLLQTVRAELSRSRFARQPSITSESTLGSLREEIRVGPTSEPFGELSMLFAAPVLMNGYWYNSVAAYVYSKLSVVWRCNARARGTVFSPILVLDHSFAGSNLEKTIRMSPDATTGPTAASQSENDGMRVPQFEQVQDAVMLTALYAKFAQHAELRELLVWTGERKIVCTLPDPHWGGATNRLGELLSHVRSKFVYRPAFASPTAAAAESTPRKSSAPSAVACSSPCRTAPLESVVEASVVEPAIVDSELEESESVGAGAGRTSSEGVARDGGDPREIASVPVVAAVAGDRSADTVVQSPPGALPSPTSAPPTGARVDEAPDDDNLVVADAPQESLPLEQLSSEAEATVSAGSAAPVVVVEASTDVVA